MVQTQLKQVKQTQMWADNDDRLLPADMGVDSLNLKVTKSLCFVVCELPFSHPEHHTDFPAKTHTPHRATKPSTMVDVASSKTGQNSANITEDRLS